MSASASRSCPTVYHFPRSITPRSMLHLIGIDPDYRLHVSERLLGQHDGSMLEALKKLNGGALNLPARNKDYPDRDRLALRFERFKAAA